MIPIGYLIINDERKMRILNNSTVALLILFLINFVLVNALKMGNTLYTSDFYMGGFAGGTLYMAAIAVAIFPYAMKKSKNNSYKIFMIFIAFFTILIIAITLRRTAIILALLGIIIYFFSAKKGISTFLGIIFLFIVMTYLSLPFFQKTIISRYELRQERFESDFYEDEGRFLEYGIIFEESLTSLNKFLIGEEIFNSAGYYADGAYGERMIHSGFPALIHGSGYIGLLLFMMIFIKLFFKYWRNRKAIKIYQLTSESQLFISLFVLNIALTASGALLETDTRCLLYIYLGASLGVMEFKIKSLSSNIAQIKNQI